MAWWKGIRRNMDDNSKHTRLLMDIRQAMLQVVASIERYLNITPTTKEARDNYKSLHK